MLTGLSTHWRRSAAEITKQLSPLGIAIAITTVGEVYEGAFGFPRPEEHLASLRVFIQPFPVLTLTDPIMERFARIRALLRRQGNLIPDFDILVGAIALDYDLTVLTYSDRHFTRIPGLKLYHSGRRCEGNKTGYRTVDNARVLALWGCCGSPLDLKIEK